MRTRPLPGSPPDGQLRARYTLTSALPTRLRHAHHQVLKGSSIWRDPPPLNESRVISKEAGLKDAVPALHRSKILQKRVGVQGVGKLSRPIAREPTGQSLRARVSKMPVDSPHLLKGLGTLQKRNASERNQESMREVGASMRVPTPTLPLLHNANERKPGKAVIGLGSLQQRNASERNPESVQKVGASMQIPAPPLLLLPGVNEGEKGQAAKGLGTLRKPNASEGNPEMLPSLQVPAPTLLLLPNFSERERKPEEPSVSKMPSVSGQSVQGINTFQNPESIRERVPSTQVPAPTLLLIPSVSERKPRPDGESSLKMPAMSSLRWHALLAQFPHTTLSETVHPSRPSDPLSPPTLHRPPIRPAPHTREPPRKPAPALRYPGSHSLSYSTTSPEPTPLFWDPLHLNPTSHAPYTRVPPPPKSNPAPRFPGSQLLQPTAHFTLTHPTPSTREFPPPKPATPHLPSPLHRSPLSPTPNPQHKPPTTQSTASLPTLAPSAAHSQLPTPAWMKRLPGFLQHTPKLNRPAR